MIWAKRMRKHVYSRRFSVLVLTLGLGWAVCGCVSLFPKSKPIQLYEFGRAPAPATSPGLKESVGVALATIHMPVASASDQILALTGQEGAYIGGARWVVPAVTQFQADTERAFELHSQRVRLLRFGDVGTAAAILRLDVGDFEAHYDAPGATPTIVVSVRASLSRFGRPLIASQTFTVRQPAEANRISAIVAAYDTAVLSVLGQVVTWTDANAPQSAG